MSDSIAPQAIVSLTITLLNNGQIRIDGIPQDKMLCYGLIETAKDEIRTYFEEQAKQRAGGLTVVRQPLNGNGG